MDEAAHQIRKQALAEAKSILIGVAGAGGTISYSELAKQIKAPRLAPYSTAMNDLLVRLFVIRVTPREVIPARFRMGQRDDDSPCPRQ